MNLEIIVPTYIVCGLVIGAVTKVVTEEDNMWTYEKSIAAMLMWPAAVLIYLFLILAQVIAPSVRKIRDKVNK